jgi:hypothetical protein
VSGSAVRFFTQTGEVYSCPRCLDSGTVLVRRHAPDDPNATRAGDVLEWKPCPARPCRIPKDEAEAAGKRGDGAGSLGLTY